MPDSTVRRFFGEERPTSAVGRLALALVLRDEGDRAGAEREVRAVWQSAELSAELKTTMLDPSSTCAVERRDFPVGDKPTRQLSLRPVAIGAVVEVTKRLKPSV
jgi:hypothetical protein